MACRFCCVCANRMNAADEHSARFSLFVVCQQKTLRCCTHFELVYILRTRPQRHLPARASSEVRFPNLNFRRLEPFRVSLFGVFWSSYCFQCLVPMCDFGLWFCCLVVHCYTVLQKYAELLVKRDLNSTFIRFFFDYVQPLSILDGCTRRLY